MASFKIYSLIISVIFTLAVAFVAQRAAIKLAFRLKILDQPSARRRHDRPTPLTGGLGIFAAWAIGLIFFCAADTSWLSLYWKSLLPLGIALAGLVTLGLWDDLKGLGPYPKLAIETIAALIVVTFDPQIKEVVLHWQAQAGFIVWPLVLLWIVGITNAMNLIDGLDGLAGGMSTLVAGSILVFCVSMRQGAEFGIVAMALFIPSLLGFLIHNWSPARIFMGDNGSLPLGFLLACMTLTCRPQNKSWIMIASMGLMLGYPLLDTGLAVLRRLRKGQPLFKADRVHLHHRLLRLGLTPAKATLVLLSIGLYLQLTALCLNFMKPAEAAFGIALIASSLLLLLFLIQSIEKRQVEQLFQSLCNQKPQPVRASQNEPCTVLSIDITPLLESGTHEEKLRIEKLLAAFDLMLTSSMRKEDAIFVSDNAISLILNEVPQNQMDHVARKFKDKIRTFSELYNLQCSLSSLPVKVERRGNP